jgi:hypothetical protein
MPRLRASKGFIAHSGGPNLPPGIAPNRTYYALHSAFTA